METIIGVVIGGVLAIAGGVISSLIQTNRDHDRWLRGLRYAALVAFLEFGDKARFRALMNQPHDESDAAMMNLQSIASRVAFIAPTMSDYSDELRDALIAMVDEQDSGRERYNDARKAYMTAARKLLAIAN